MRKKHLRTFTLVKKFNSTIDRSQIQLPGKLETVNGEACLRLADSVHGFTAQEGQITSTWLRPGKQPFDPELYP